VDDEPHETTLHPRAAMAIPTARGCNCAGFPARRDDPIISCVHVTGHWGASLAGTLGAAEGRAHGGDRRRL